MPKESWSTDMSPTTLFTLWDTARAAYGMYGVGEGVPGVVRDGVGPGGAIPVPCPGTLQDPYLVIFQRLSPTHGQMKAFFY